MISPPRSGRLPAASLAATPVALALLVAPSPPASGETFRFGAYERSIENLEDPSDVAITADGEIAIALGGARRVEVYSRAGERLRTFAGGRNGEDVLDRPAGIAFLPDGRLVVTNADSHEVTIFSSDGRTKRDFGGYGTEPGFFNEPRGVTVDGDRIFVVDVGNRRVQVFDDEGTLLGIAAAEGSRDEGREALERPADVAVGPGGSVFVTDAAASDVKRFDSQGSFVAAWGDWGPFEGLLDQPGGVVAIDDEIFVADTRNHRVQIFGAQGDVIEAWGVHASVPHEGEGRLHYPSAVAIAPDRSFAVVCEPFERRCQIFAARPAGEPAPEPPLMPRRKQAHFGARLDVAGKLLVLSEPESHRVYLFDMERDVPIVIGEFGERGSACGLFIECDGLSLDLDPPSVTVSDPVTRRLQKFLVEWSPDEPRRYVPRRARLASAWDLGGLADELEQAGLSWLPEPITSARDRAGKTYVLDGRNRRVLVFDAEAQLVGAVGEYSEPSDLDVVSGPTSGATIYVADAARPAIVVFDGEEREERLIGEGSLVRPAGVAVARDGSVYVTDRGTHSVMKFAPDGSLVGSWGGLGVDHGKLWNPGGIVEDERGRLIVSDVGNHRAQIFSADGEWLVTFGLGRATTKFDAVQ